MSDTGSSAIFSVFIMAYLFYNFTSNGGQITKKPFINVLLALFPLLLICMPLINILEYTYVAFLDYYPNDSVLVMFETAMYMLTLFLTLGFRLWFSKLESIVTTIMILAIIILSPVIRDNGFINKLIETKSITQSIEHLPITYDEFKSRKKDELEHQDQRIEERKQQIKSDLLWELNREERLEQKIDLLTEEIKELKKIEKYPTP